MRTSAVNAESIESLVAAIEDTNTEFRIRCNDHLQVNARNSDDIEHLAERIEDMSGRLDACSLNWIESTKLNAQMVDFVNSLKTSRPEVEFDVSDLQQATDKRPKQITDVSSATCQ